MSDLSTNDRPTLLTRWFTAHPATVNESYLQHMRFALWFAFWLGLAGLAAFAHAVVPAVCETTAGRILRKLTARMDARH